MYEGGLRHVALREEVHLATAGHALTLDGARRLGRELDRRLGPTASHVVLDLSVTRLAARPALVVALRSARAAMARRRGRVTVVAPVERHATLSRLAVLDETLDLAPTLGAALAVAGPAYA